MKMMLFFTRKTSADPRALVKEFMTFSCIGVINTIVHGIFYYIFYILLCVQAIANLLAFVMAVVCSFFLNAKFTFRKTPQWISFIKMFFFMSAVSYTFGYLGDYFTMHFMLTFILYSICNPILNFMIMKFLVFQHSANA